MSEDLDALRAEIQKLHQEHYKMRQTMAHAAIALEQSNTAMWDSCYGKGLSVAYAQAAHAAVKDAQKRLASYLPKGFDPGRPATREPNTPTTKETAMISVITMLLNKDPDQLVGWMREQKVQNLALTDTDGRRVVVTLAPSFPMPTPPSDE